MIQVRQGLSASVRKLVGSDGCEEPRPLDLPIDPEDGKHGPVYPFASKGIDCRPGFRGPHRLPKPRSPPEALRLQPLEPSVVEGDGHVGAGQHLTEGLPRGSLHLQARSSPRKGRPLV